MKKILTKVRTSTIKTSSYLLSTYRDIPTLVLTLWTSKIQVSRILDYKELIEDLGEYDIKYKNYQPLYTILLALILGTSGMVKQFLVFRLVVGECHSRRRRLDIALYHYYYYYYKSNTVE